MWPGAGWLPLVALVSWRMSCSGQRSERAANSPAAALQALRISGSVRGRLGGSANMQWLTDDGADRLVLRRYEVQGGYWMTSLGNSSSSDDSAQMDGECQYPVQAPAFVGGHVWAIMTWVPGRRRRPRTDAARMDRQRRRGRLLRGAASGHAEPSRHWSTTGVDIDQRLARLESRANCPTKFSTIHRSSHPAPETCSGDTQIALESTPPAPVCPNVRRSSCMAISTRRTCFTRPTAPSP